MSRQWFDSELFADLLDRHRFMSDNGISYLEGETDSEYNDEGGSTISLNVVMFIKDGVTYREDDYADEDAEEYDETPFDRLLDDMGYSTSQLTWTAEYDIKTIPDLITEQLSLLNEQTRKLLMYKEETTNGTTELA